MVAAGTRKAHPEVLDAFSATTDAQRRSLDALANGAVCVVTGQQAGLFGGPLYTVYKAAAAIVNARALAIETGTPCVPVFWLQNEDHDYDEIDHCQVLSATGSLTHIRVEGDAGSPLRSVRARTLDPTQAHAELAEALGSLPHAAATASLLARCWTPDCHPDQAFKAWIEALFAPHGLLVLDPSLPQLQDAAAPVHQRAIAEAAAISTALQERSEALVAAGYKVQVHVRPDAPLCFVHPQGADGPRHRVLVHGDGYRTPDGLALTADQVRKGPHSTSALLRPLLQDTWLPTAAYVGGPGEVAYFAQLPVLYDHFGLPMPMVVPRARFRVHDQTADRLLAQLGLDADALTTSRSSLLAAVARSEDRPNPDALLRELTEPALAALMALAPHARALDPGLVKVVDKTGDSFTRQAQRLVQRYRKTLALADDVAVSRLDRVRARLAPDGVPQERVHGWPWYAARFGVDGFVRQVLDAAVPYDGTLRELRP